MASALEKLKAELEKKRKEAEPLREVVASKQSPASIEQPEKKKKVYLTNGQAKKLQAELTVRVGAGLAREGGIGSEENCEGPLSPEQISAQKSAIEGKKMIPTAEVFKRLRPDVEEIDGGQKNFMLEEMKKLKEKGGAASSDEEELSPEEKKAKKQAKLDRLLEAESSAKIPEELIKTWIKRVLKEWEMDLDELPEQIAASVKGKTEINTFKQTRTYLKPLFKHLRNRTLQPDILARLDSIVGHCKARNYTKAADEYLLLSIGKAAWPMGVTMVGIHERSAREKIFTQDVAHILNDETQRKFIQSVKRLMTYSQNKYPPESFSQAIEPTCIDTHAPTMLKEAGKVQAVGFTGRS